MSTQPFFPLLLVATTIFSYSPTYVLAEIEEIKIGFAAPLTGPQAIYGKDVQNGVVLAIEDFNAKQPEIGGKKVKVVLLSENDKADAHTGMQIAKKLVDIDIKGMLGPMNSNVAIPASSIYHQANIPQISAATAPEYTQQNFNTTFRMLPSDVRQGTVMGDFAVKKLGLKEIVIIDDRSAYGQGLAKQFEKSATMAGAKIIRHEFSFDKASNFKSTLIGLKKLKVQGIFYGGTAIQAVPLVQQMRELGIKATLLGADMLKVDSFTKNAGIAAEGTVVSVAGKPLQAMPGGQAFSQRYEKRFGIPTGSYAPYAYDSTVAMLTAMEKANSADPKKYLDYLAKTKIPAVTRKKLSYNSRGDLIDRNTSIYKVVNGQWQLLAVVNNATIVD